MFEIVFLGTSASAPSVHRGLPSLAVLAGEQRYLIDCGEGTQRQILRSGIGFKRLNNILLTHSHLDHILGLGGLISTFASWEDIHDIQIWGGNSTLKRVSQLLFGVVLDYDNLPIDISLNELTQPTTLGDNKEFTVRAFPVTHRGTGNFAFSFKEHDHRPFLAEKATELGVPVGPERSRLVKGESITLDNGRVIEPTDVLGETEPGMKIVITGDIARTDNILHEAQDANVLVTEATFLHEEAHIAKKFGHLTTRKAAEFAREANIDTLILTHVSRRYRERDIINEARAIFPNTYVARDFDQYTVRRGKPVIRKSREFTNEE